MTITSSRASDMSAEDTGADAEKKEASAYTERKLPDGTTVVAARLRLPSGWNKDEATVEFVLPIPYPNAQPDCFFTNPDLRLAGGGMPSNTGQQQLDGQPRLWFSWHLASWDPARNDISTYLRFIESRFRDAR